MPHRKLNKIILLLQSRVFLILPYVLLVGLTGFIGIANRTPETWLTGWDNLHPEFNFLMNIKRSLFAVWQEYQGLGLLGGMGHATALPREILLAVFSPFIPTYLLRYVWTIGMLGIGAIGTYALLEKYLLPKIIPKNSKHIIRIAGLAGGIFYVTNLATIQMFHVPYEAFSAHFGYLPWLIYGFLLLLERVTRKRLFFFTFLNIISATQAYVPTVFVVYGIILIIISVVHFIAEQNKKRIMIRLGITMLILLITNMYWLLPFGYFTATKSHVNINAKINQMATEEVYLRNKAFGTLNDTIQLKGFWFDTFDFDPQKSQTTPLLSVWNQHSKKPLSVGLSYAFFFLVCFSAILLLLKRRRATWWISIACFVSITMLTTDTYPFSLINEIIRKHIPLINQAFRFPFTKWSIANAWLYSLLIAVSIAFFLQRLEKLKVKKIIQTILIIITFACLTHQSLPLISGNLFYDPMQQKIPSEYFELFEYLKQKPIGRIANFPQTTFWGWTYYRWGYTGSGFPWYGIEHPIIDRAFDTWSRENENYYWEVSLALYSKDPQKLQSVFEKYDVAYILLDESVISPSHNRALFTDEIKMLLEKDPYIIHEKKFGHLTLYERQTKSNSFVATAQQLPNIFPTYVWGDTDKAHLEYGPYKTDTTDTKDTTYIFRTLFSKRSIDEQILNITEDADNLIIESSDDIFFRNKPQFLSHSIPAEILLTENGKVQIKINKSKALRYDAQEDQSIPLQASKVIPCGIGRNGVTHVEESGFEQNKNLVFKSTNQRLCFSFSSSTLSHSVGYIIAVESKHVSGRPLLFALINQTGKHTEIETFLSREKEFKTAYLFVPPLGFDGLGYTFYFSNDSIGRNETINELRNIRVYEIPYQEMIQMKDDTSKQNILEREIIKPLLVSHPNTSYYQITMPNNAKTLILYQSFHSGWKAYEVNSLLGEMFTFLFGKELKHHFLVNNWANGWEIPEGEGERTIVIFFLPQLLQWFGFFLLPIPFLFLFIKKIFV